ncbi:phage tail protein [Pseudomonas luteola]|uniref:phage tail protein n=1 Tax=Pseudomonas luteola TaxID=47886 RepID=UPI003CC7474A
MAESGSAWPMIEGTGRILGVWVIESISETRTIFFRDGAARRIEFTLSLKRIDNDRTDILGAASPRPMASCGASYDPRGHRPGHWPTAQACTTRGQRCQLSSR